MKLSHALRYACVALTLVCGSGWGADTGTGKETAPATPGLGAPTGSQTPGVPSQNAPGANDPGSADGAIDLRHMDKTQKHTPPHESTEHKQPSGDKKSGAQPATKP